MIVLFHIPPREKVLNENEFQEYIDRTVLLMYTYVQKVWQFLCNTFLTTLLIFL